MGRRYSILNLICLGTAFQQAVLLKEGKNPTSSQVLRALMNRWVSWGGNPVELACDRGRRNRGVVAKYCGENNRQVRHAPLECPEDIGRVERHGGILKAMYKKVAVEVQPMGPDDVEKILNECCRVKNASTRVGGFSPAQWIFGSDPRAAASSMNEGWTDLGGLAGQTDPTLEGHPIVPSEVIGDDQKFLDARSYLEQPEIPEDVSNEPSIAPGMPVPTIPEDVEVESEEEESPVVGEQGRSRAMPTRRQSVFPPNSRNVRQRTESTQLPVSVSTLRQRPQESSNRRRLRALPSFLNRLVVWDHCHGP